MPKYITKNLFLSFLKCPTYGYLQQQQPTQPTTSPSDQLRIDEGNEVQERARTLFPEGLLVSGSNETCINRTKELLSNPEVSTIFEATFQSGPYITKADILIRTNSKWKMIEIKSAVNQSDEHVNDMGYTTFVALQSGLEISSCSLLLVNKDYRLGMTDDNLLVEIDLSSKVSVRANEFCELSESIAQILSSEEQPTPELKWECKHCEIFTECCGEGIDNHIFDLPRISHTKFCQLKDMGVVEIEEIPGDFELTEKQEIVRKAVVSGEPVIDREGLREDLDSIVYPCYYLDFETVQSCYPLFEEIAPYSQIVTQYSIHVCSAPGHITDHREYLADPSRDCRRELAERLIRDCGTEGSIVVYTSFEKTIINGLAKLFPDLSEDLGKLVGRLVDLHKIIRNCYYHPGFHGSYSIKKVLPVLVPGLGYDGMAIGNGLDASAVFAGMARGKYSRGEMEEVRRQLLEYCCLDTMAMVRLEEGLRVVVE